jgi:magnesium-transporting ATPase (P-type)
MVVLAPLLAVHSVSLQIWMLTGDKSETAVNIGFATQMLTNDMELLLLTLETLGSPGTEIDRVPGPASVWLLVFLCSYVCAHVLVRVRLAYMKNLRLSGFTLQMASFPSSPSRRLLPVRQPLRRRVRGSWGVW